MFSYSQEVLRGIFKNGGWWPQSCVQFTVLFNSFHTWLEKYLFRKENQYKQILPLFCFAFVVLEIDTRPHQSYVSAMLELLPGPKIYFWNFPPSLFVLMDYILRKTWQPDFSPHGPHNGRKELTPESYPLTFTCM